MTYTTFNLANSTFRILVPAYPNIKLEFLPRFGCKQQKPTKQHTL